MSEHDIAIFPCADARTYAFVQQLWLAYAASLPADVASGSMHADLGAIPGYYVPPLGTILLAHTGGAAVGCIAVRPLDAVTGEIKRLYVSPGHRGRGIARALLEAAIGHARQVGFRTLRLGTLRSMTAAQALYLRTGFRETGPYPGYDTVDELYFALSLDGLTTHLC